MIKSTLFIVSMFVGLLFLILLIEKKVPKSENFSGLKLYLLRVSIGVVPAIILGVMLFFIFLN